MIKSRFNSKNTQKNFSPIVRALQPSGPYYLATSAVSQSFPSQSLPQSRAGIWCTQHICQVTHTLTGPTHCGAHLCVRDTAYMPGTTYNFCPMTPFLLYDLFTTTINSVWILLTFSSCNLLFLCMLVTCPHTYQSTFTSHFTPHSWT